MAAADIFKLLGTIGVDNGDANKKIDETVSKAGKAGSSVGKSFNTMSDGAVNFARNSAVALAGVATAVGGFSIKAAGDMQALNAQFNQSFEGLGDAPTDSLNKLSEQFNILPNRLKGPMSQINSFFKGSGVSAKDSLGMTSDAMNIAADSAAFYDTSIEDTSTSLKGFLMGNYENGDAIGINTNQTKIAAAYNKKYKGSFDDLSDAAKQKFLLEYVKDVQQASGVTGQGAREMNGLENVMGNMKQTVKDLAAAIGTPFLQPFINLVSLTSKGMSSLAAILTKNPALVYAIAGALGTLVAAFTAVYLSANNFAAVKTAIEGVKTAMTVLTNPVFLVVVAIGALVTAFIYFYNTSETFRNAVNGTIGPLIEKMKQLFTDFVPTIQAVGDKIGDFVNKIKSMFTGMNFTLPSWLTDLSTIGPILIGLLTPLGPVIAAFKLLSLVLGNSTIQNGLTQMVTAFDSFSATVLTNAPTAGAAFGNMLQGILTAIGLALPGIIQGALTIVAGFIQGIAQGIPQIVIAASQFIAAFTMAIVTLAPQLVTSAVLMIASFMGPLTVALPQLIMLGTNFVVSLLNGLTTALPRLIIAGVNLIVTFLNGVATQMPQLIAAGANLIGQFLIGITQQMPELANKAITLVISFANTIISNMPRILTTAVNLMNSFLTGLASKMPSIIQSAVTLIVSFLNGISRNIGSIINAGVSLIVAILNGISRNINRIVTAGIGIVNSLVNGILKMQQGLIDAGVKLMNGLASGITRNRAKVQAAARNLLTAIVESFPGGKLVTSGARLIAGLVKGIAGAATSAVKAAASVAGNIVKSVKNVLGIHSPSRVMAEVGDFFTQGLANGITDAIPVATAAANALTDAVYVDPNAMVPDLSAADAAINNRELASTMAVRATADNPAQAQNAITISGIINLLSRYLPTIAEQKQLVLDDGTLVGSTKDKYDVAFGDDAILKDRGAK